ncbi:MULTISPECIES: hypothetical protein [unclassified Paenibacillus]|uniref:hypothetical protein n=1 Tax=unclassified Paenibacillus TaxID=185978 RepID=UPI000AB4A7C8|nr:MULTISPECIES: hypothetical protein [unclassified Paenibacillus]
MNESTVLRVAGTGSTDEYTKPRLPVPAVYFENHYSSNLEAQRERIGEYDEPK